MSPGISEEVGSTARGFMTAMSSQPVMLGMVIIVLSMIAMLWFALRYAGDARKNEYEMIFKQQAEFMQILSRCVVPGGATPQRFKLQSADDDVQPGSE